MSQDRPEMKPFDDATTIRRLLESEAAGGLLLMAVALLAILVANSPLGEGYFSALHLYVGPLSVQHWVNDALMAVFFLMVGLEIKREMVAGELSSWSRRVLPGAAAAGGMVAPALIYAALNHGDAEALRGWAIPTATDIAFALGVLALLGPRVPVSLKIFLTALAIVDDLGAIVVIALFYTDDLAVGYLALAVGLVAVLSLLNRFGVRRLLPYLLLGLLLWVAVLKSGVHATVAGVVLALTIPMAGDHKKSLLHRLEHAIQWPVAFLVVPIFGFANAGVPLSGATLASFAEPVAFGVAAGLVLGKLVGVFGCVVLLVRLGWAQLPAAANWGHMVGVSLLCGIGFTMSLFIGLLAFDDPTLQAKMKFGILTGSIVASLLGSAVLIAAGKRSGQQPSPSEPADFELPFNSR